MIDVLQTAAARVRTSAYGAWADGKGLLLVVIATGWALSIGLRFVYPAVMPFVRSEFAFGLSTTGLLLAFLWGAYAVGHIPGGLLGDRVGKGNVLVASGAISTVAIVGVAASPTVAVLFVATVAFGLATALYGPTRFTILTDLYPRGSGSAIGLTMAAGNVGNAAFPVLATVVTGALTWRLGFVAFVPLFGLVTVGLWVTLPGRTASEERAATELSWGLVRRLRNGITAGAIPVVVAIQVALSFVIQGFTSFYPLYLTEVKQLSPKAAATLFGGFFLLGALVQPVAGRLVDRFGAKRTLSGFLTACVLPLWALPFVSGFVPLAAVTAAFATWNGTVVVTQTYIAETLPAETQGTGFGVLKAGWMLVGATAPLVVGLLAEAGSFDQAFLLLGVVAGLAAVLAASRLL